MLEGESDFGESKPRMIDVPEEFDWSSMELNREFIDLEQKVLARKGSAAERRRYELMRASRNRMIFASRYVDDYAEAQRIKALCMRLSDLHKYLRPIATR